MKQILHLFFLFFLLSCSLPTTSLPPTATLTPHATLIHTASAIPSQTQPPTPTSVPIPPTATIIPCDAFVEDYCVTDGHFIFQRPMKPPTTAIVDPTYPYGSTAKGARDPHHGVEFQSPFGTPVYAAGDGVILFAGPDEKAIYSPWANFYGNLVVIEHENNLFTLYAHLSKVDVETGDVITVGEKIGDVGQTGAATGSHLHFEVRQGEVEDYFSTVNPELWLAPTKNDSGALAISIADPNGDFRMAELTANHYLDSSQPPVTTFYAITYSRDLSTGVENAVVSDLAPGNYRIAMTMNGTVYDRWVEVKSGRLTQVVFVVK